MRPILIDTNAYSAFKKNTKEVVEVVQHASLLFVSPIVLGELISGFDAGNRALQNKAELQKFLDSSRVVIYPITIDTAHFFSKVYNSLKSRGKPIPTNDMWIAAHALEHGCVICTFDKHFSYIEGLISGSSKAELLI